MIIETNQLDVNPLQTRGALHLSQGKMKYLNQSPVEVVFWNWLLWDLSLSNKHEILIRLLVYYEIKVFQY